MTLAPVPARPDLARVFFQDEFLKGMSQYLYISSVLILPFRRERVDGLPC
jgi:hypothetical protein